MADTNYGGIGNRTAGYAARRMLEHAKPHIVLGNLGDQKPLPKNKTQVIKWRRRVAFPDQTTPLSEGVTPTAIAFSYADVQATIAQYGLVVNITDHVNDTSEDPVLRDATMMAGENLASTSEQVTYGVVKAGTNVFYSNGTATNTINTAISDASIDAMVRNLHASKGMPITPRVSASTKIATEGLAPAFVFVGHTDLQYDIEQLTGFTPVEKYGSYQPISMHELGKRRQVRFILSADLKPDLGAGSATLNGMVSNGGSNVDVYHGILLAEHAFGHVPLSGADSVSPIVINPSTPSKSDPLGQMGHVGWKRWYTAAILNQLWMARLETGATDL